MGKEGHRHEKGGEEGCGDHNFHRKVIGVKGKAEFGIRTAKNRDQNPRGGIPLAWKKKKEGT